MPDRLIDTCFQATCTASSTAPWSPWSRPLSASSSPTTSWRSSSSSTSRSKRILKGFNLETSLLRRPLSRCCQLLCFKFLLNSITQNEDSNRTQVARTRVEFASHWAIYSKATSSVNVWLHANKTAWLQHSFCTCQKKLNQGGLVLFKSFLKHGFILTAVRSF